jgi:hypothetical protein
MHKPGMKTTFLFLLVLNAAVLTSQNVLFGERDLNVQNLSVYFDKEGFLYPNYRVSNVDLLKSGSSMKRWYLDNSAHFLEICGDYGCPYKTCTSENCTGLNDAVAVALKRKINEQAKNYSSVTFLIHGFRKPFVSDNRDTDSPTDFSILKATVDKYYGEKTLYVDVYWDGLYDCCFSAKPSHNKRLFKLFEAAQINAEFVGRALKKIITGLDFNTVNIITYSLGAKIAAHALLNIDGSSANTPANRKVNICLIAPAISAGMIFDNYYKRNSGLNLRQKDNYNLLIVYNENDFALRKKDPKLGWFGPGPYKYGNTTLGCNCDKAATTLQNQFKKNYPGSSIQLFDLSQVGRCHLVRCYSQSNYLEAPIKYLANQSRE